MARYSERILEVRAGKARARLRGDCRVGNHLIVRGSFEPETISMLPDMVRPATTMLDIGCYTGLYAILCASLGASSVGFEPMPVLQARIRENAELSGQSERVHVVEAAASDHDGTALLMYNPQVHLTSGASIEQRTGVQTMEVPVLSVDSLDLRDVSLVKIDVEHHEMSVIQGMMGIIQRDRPWMIVEVLDDEEKSSVMDALSPTHILKGIADSRNLILEPR